MIAKVSKLLNTLLQILIIVAAYGFLYREFAYKRDISQLLSTLTESLNDKRFILPLSVVLVLMILNLSIEAYKWKYLIGKFERVSLMQAIKAVFSGITVSMFTPNRVGDYFGRVFILKHLHPLKGALITMMGNLGQLLVTVLTGLLSLLFLLPMIFDIRTSPNNYLFAGIIITACVVIFLLLVLYLNFSFGSDLLQKILPRKWEMIRKHKQVFKEYNAGELSYVLILSLLRYGVFTGQFMILLSAFGVVLPVLQLLVVISAIFFVITIIPTIALSELGVRGSVSVQLFGLYFVAGGLDAEHLAPGVFAASTMLWLINLAIPAIAGTLFVFHLKFIRPNNSRPS